ncbi:MAG: caspase family protein [Alphaproteobacteria bacterium]|nr:caspase family protein [Alphaproteobacteria bacterium]
MTRLPILAALLALPVSGWADTRRFALIAGANDGGADRVRLQYAVTDAEAFASVLSDLGGVPTSNQTLLVEPNADVLREAIGNLTSTVAVAEERGLRTEVVVYYSGHSDETGLLLGQQRYPYDELRADLKGIGADVQVVVLDSCASGAMVRTKGGVHRPAFLEDQSNDVEGVAYLMSASADESAQESDLVGASYFTHYLVSGMRGGADRTGDGRVTLDEAYAFAASETLKRTERTSVGPQHAIFDMNMKGHGGFVFTDLTQTTSSLVFDEAVAGRLFVRDGQGRLVAELQKGPERAVEVALKDGTYTVVLEQGEQRLEAVFDIGSAEHLLVTELQFAPIATESVAVRGPVAEAPPDRVQEVVAAPVPDLPPRYEDVPAQVGFLPRAGESAAQVGIVGTFAEHNRALQIGTIYTRADTLDGVQLALAFAHAETMNGAQLAIGANVATDASGVQAGLMNIATESAQGMQVGLVNTSRELDGFQVGLVNNAGTSRAFQVGLINHGGNGSGLQLGLVNVAADYDGGAVGLVTIHRNGYNHFFVNTGTANTVLLTGAWGGKHLYSVLQFGTRGFFAGPGLTGGVGAHVPLRERVYLDGDLTTGVQFAGDVSSITRFRVQPGWELTDRLGVQTGVVAEIDSGLGLAFRDMLRLGWTVGLRI